jgi:RNA 3'-phosphate cyclase
VGAGCAILTQTPIHVLNIRKNRDKPGLRTQHLVGLEAAANLCGGHLEGGHVGSTEITFRPGTITKDHISLSIATAGSVGLVLQVLQIACLQAKGHPISVDIAGGGTFGTGAPSTSFIQNVTYPAFAMMGYHVKVEVLKQGFYPKGGAQAHAVFNAPNEIQSINLEDRGKLTRVGGMAVVHNSLRTPRVAERIVEQVKKSLAGTPPPVEIDTQYVNAMSVGVGVDMWAEFCSGIRLGTGTILGERGVSSEKVGQSAALELKNLLACGATVDIHLSDQILPLMAACPEPCVVVTPSLTLHAKTNIDILALFYPNVKFSTETCGSLVKISSKPA